MAHRTGAAPYPTVDAIQQSWADRIRGEREARGWTIEAVAATLDVRHSTVSRWETYRSNIPDVVKLRLAGLYGIHPAELFVWPASTPPAPLQRPTTKRAA